LVLLAGGDQSGIVGEALPVPLRVKVTAASGAAVQGVPVGFEVSAGGGEMRPAEVVTDSLGEATAVWTLGPMAGVDVNAANVSVAGLEPLVLRASAAAGAASVLVAVSGDSQTGDLGEGLREPLVAAVLDRFGNGVPGQVVSWSVVVGGGSIGATDTTDFAGRSAARWTLGNRLDTVHSAIASADSLTALRFQATPVLPNDAQVIGLAGDGQSARAATVLAESLVARVSLADGRPVVGAWLRWSAASSGGSFAPDSTRTDTSGRAAAAWVLGADAGPQVAGALAGFLAPALFRATGLVRFEAVNAGANHTCALTDEGRTFCWGADFNGQLGLGYPTGVTVFAPLRSVARLLTVTNGGSNHTCGLDAGRFAFCWGSNARGQLGLAVPPGGDVAQPQAVAGGASFAAVSAANIFTCGLTEAGSAYCWGAGDIGQLGVDSLPFAQSAPAAVAGGRVFTSISAGGAHACALTPDGIVFCWGSNSFRQIGTGDTAAVYSTPAPAAGSLEFASVSTGSDHTCALTREGRGYCWGSNTFGELGIGPGGSGATPSAVAGDLTFATISTGAGFSCGLIIGGQAYCWGRNLEGQLGTGSASFGESAPVPVSGTLSFRSLSVGGFHACGITVEGLLHCWGRGFYGAVGTGETADTPTPTRVLYQAPS
jgi:alpha-tubulin suppressor-like RCC1 family protein